MKPAQIFTVAFLVLVALTHVLRLLFRTAVTVAGQTIPMWVSAPAIILTLGLAWALVRESRTPRP
jgi:hypothetical protein